MKVLYILKSTSDDTLKTIMELQEKDNDITVVNLSENKNYDEIVDLIDGCDRVITW